ncbi:hypothetical protein M948_20655 [Virgibacillus sp. CM-4]|nr:hypothetical protein M948_20655 [Virgibacillus sp. CM-4]
MNKNITNILKYLRRCGKMALEVILMEKWVNLKYEGYERYQISNFGSVIGMKGRMKSRANARGYFIIGLRKPNDRKQRMFSIHRLVAEHFIDNPYGKNYVNHIDGDKSNNTVDNLEWVTQSENQIHAYTTNLQVKTPEQVERMKYYAKKKRRPIRVVNKKLGIDKTFESIKDASEHIECNEKTLRNTLKGRNKSRLGYEVFYLDES